MPELMPDRPGRLGNRMVDPRSGLLSIADRRPGRVDAELSRIVDHGHHIPASPNIWDQIVKQSMNDLLGRYA